MTYPGYSKGYAAAAPAALSRRVVVSSSTRAPVTVAVADRPTVTTGGGTR